jgi:CrcB protein
MLNIYLSLALGGAIGACLRFFVANAVVKAVPGHLSIASLSLGTLVVNILGSFLIGVLFVLLHEKAHIPMSLKPMLMTGLLGAFTTFSTFSLETLTHLTDGHYWQALSYVLLSVICCVFATFVGVSVTRLF